MTPPVVRAEDVPAVPIIPVDETTTPVVENDPVVVAGDAVVAGAGDAVVAGAGDAVVEGEPVVEGGTRLPVEDGIPLVAIPLVTSPVPVVEIPEALFVALIANKLTLSISVVLNNAVSNTNVICEKYSPKRRNPINTKESFLLIVISNVSLLLAPVKLNSVEHGIVIFATNPPWSILVTTANAVSLKLRSMAPMRRSSIDSL